MALQSCSCSQALHKERTLAGRFCAAALPYLPVRDPIKLTALSRPFSPSSFMTHNTAYSPSEQDTPHSSHRRALAIGSTADAMNHERLFSSSPHLPLQSPSHEILRPPRSCGTSTWPFPIIVIVASHGIGTSVLTESLRSQGMASSGH